MCPLPKPSWPYFPSLFSPRSQVPPHSLPLPSASPQPSTPQPLHTSYLTPNVHPWTPHVPDPPTTSLATLHPPKKTSPVPFARPLVWAKQNRDEFGSLCLVGHLAAPLDLWRGQVAPAPPWQLGGQAGHPTAPMLHRFHPIFSENFFLLSEAAWLLSGRGLELVMSLFQSFWQG